MHGWRKRIGLIIPSSNTTMECELWRHLPEGISLHTSRMPLKEVNTGALDLMEKHSEKAAKDLMDAEVDCLLFGCTSGSLIRGAKYNEVRSRAMEAKLGVPFITTSTAVIEALNSLKARDISVVTPYIDEVNERERRFLEECDFSVLSVKGVGIERNTDIGRITPEEVYRFASCDADGDCLFVSCTNLRTFEIIDSLEKDLGIPVVTSNQASLWFTLKRAGIKENIDGLGRLMRE